MRHGTPEICSPASAVSVRFAGVLGIVLEDKKESSSVWERVNREFRTLLTQTPPTPDAQWTTVEGGGEGGGGEGGEEER